MKSVQPVGFSLLLLVAGASTAAVGQSPNPLSETISLLQSLTAKVAKEGEEEEKAYKAYVEWCDDTTTDVNFEIKTGEAKKEALEAAISKATSDAEASAAKIEDLAASIAADDSELKQATMVREKEAADFAASEAELMDVINTLERATAVLEREMAKNPAASLAQVDGSSMETLLKSLSTVVEAAGISSSGREKLLGFVQARQSPEADDDDFGAPAAAAYKTHSNNILDVLEDLKEKAEGQLSDLRKAETNASHNYKMLKQSLDDQTAANQKAMDEEKASKAASDEAKASASGDLTETAKDLENDKANLEATQTTCLSVATDHEASVKARAEELAALSEAIKVLSETTSGAVTQTYSFVQVAEDVVAGSRLRTRADLAGAEVVNLVKRLAKEQHSAALAQLASRIAAVIRFGTAAGEDPFAKVKSLIVDLIDRLEAEAGAEATEKAYCDEELAKTAAKKEELDAGIAKLSAKIDQAAASSAGLKEEVKELQAELAALAKQQAEMDALRKETHDAYVQAKADLELGLTGVRKALSVLRDYYATSSEAAMVQRDSSSALLQQPATPEFHTKAVGAGTSVIGILEVVESDFAKNLATEETTEADAQATYEKTTQENHITTTLKQQDVKYKTQEAKALDKSISEMSSDRDTASTELDAVLDYDSKLKARCIAKPETYETRKERREAEINGLKEALSILENQANLLQRRKRSFPHHFLGA